MTLILEKINTYFHSPAGDAQRIFHGRGQCYPNYEGISIDFYPPAILITLFCEYPEELIHSIVELSKNKRNVESIVIQRRYLTKSPCEVVFGKLPESHIVLEDDIKYSVTLGKSQNSGLFLDMASGRKWLKNNAKDKKILNLFSFTCSISVAALMGEASHVVNFDMAKGALNTGRTNHRINKIDTNRVEFFAHNILKSWGKIKKKGPFDIVIIDPPSFQKGSFVATKDYAKIIRHLPEFIKSNGQILAALNSPELDTEFLKGIFSTECPQATYLKRIENPETFPDVDQESSLKLMLFELS